MRWSLQGTSNKTNSMCVYHCSISWLVKRWTFSSPIQLRGEYTWLHCIGDFGIPIENVWLATMRPTVLAVFCAIDLFATCANSYNISRVHPITINCWCTRGVYMCVFMYVYVCPKWSDFSHNIPTKNTLAHILFIFCLKRSRCSSQLIRLKRFAVAFKRILNSLFLLRSTAKCTKFD